MIGTISITIDVLINNGKLILNAEIRAIKFVIKEPIKGIIGAMLERSASKIKYGCPIIRYIRNYSIISITIIK